ncbi:MAG: inactive transglutaminase family protein [Pseudomonadota bacterium]
MRNLHLKLLALCLFVGGNSLAYYKVTRLGLPFLPTERTQVWTVEARVAFEGRGRSAKVDFFVPRTPEGYTVVDEDFVSSRYGLTISQKSGNRLAQWAVRRAKGSQVLYYRIQLAPGAARATAQADTPSPPFPAQPEYPEPMGSAVQALLEEVRSKSADVLSFTRELLVRLNAPIPDENVHLLRENGTGSQKWVRKVIHILAGARIPARMIHIIKLEDRVRHGALIPWLEVHDGKKWLPFDPKSGESGLPSESLVWYVGDEPSVQIEGGNFTKIDYSISSHPEELVLVAQQRARQMGSRLMEYSLFSLPVQTQNVYRILLMVPLGAFFIVLLRNIIGVKTFGTFMPILIALAFRETELFWGVVLFSLIVAIGLMIRFYLEYLKLLLVPRLASVLIIVILVMAGISLLSHKLGIERGLSVALFPMVILAMTIERMSLVWEEHGPAEALKQGMGSLLAAILGYLIMTNSLLGHVIFVFPELLLTVLAITLLLGRYTGYRIAELWRFRALIFGGSAK